MVVKAKKRIYTWITALVIVLALGAVVFYYYQNPKKALALVVPEFDKVGFLSAKVENDTIILNTSFVLCNKSPYELEVDTVGFELKLADNTIIKQTIVQVFKIKRYQKAEVPVELRLNHKRIRELIKSLQAQDSTNLEFAVNVDYDTFLGHVAFPFSSSKRIAVPRPPKIKIVHFERHKFKFSDKTMAADVHLEVTNEGKLDLDIRELQYRLSIKQGLIETQGTFSQEIKIRPKSRKIVVIPIEIVIEKPLKLYLMVLRNKDKLPYTLNLMALIDDHFLFNQTAPVAFFKEGVMELKK